MAVQQLLRLGASRLLASGGSATTQCFLSGRTLVASTPGYNVLRAFSAEAKVEPKVAPQAEAKPSTFFRTLLLGSMAVGGVYAYSLFNSEMPQQGALSGPKQPVAVKKDYGAVRKALEDIMDVEGYDDGSYGPLLVRLAWHAAGTYDKNSQTGGSNGATMRFSPECEHAANAGLAKARDLLEPIKKQFPWISYADLWTLAGAVAIESMGGPQIPWRAGRIDKPDSSSCPPDGRLPDAAQGAAHIRDIFGRMGFTDEEMVALSGAHTLGRCHTDRSGYVNPWTNAPTTFSNLYFQELMNNRWTKKKWNGPLQYEDPTKQLMMLPTDMALIWDRKFKKIVAEYAKDEAKFFDDFSKAFSKLLELGVEFPAEPAAAA